MSRPGPQPKSWGQQVGALKANWPGGVIAGRGHDICWSGRLTPSPISPSYLIEVRYDFRGHPKVAVVDPPLQPTEEGWIPHVYVDTGKVCLALPHEWNPSMFIAKTTVPWTSTWLYYYEGWQATGQWHGGGTLHGVPERLRGIVVPPNSRT